MRTVELPVGWRGHILASGSRITGRDDPLGKLGAIWH
jgi:hypothetical protein